MLLLCVLMLAACVTVRGYSGGAPLGACDTMFPTGHQAQAKSAVTTLYKVQADKHTYTPGSKIKVTLSGTEKIEGFFLQARDANSTGLRIGTFTTSEPDVKKLNCTVPDDSVTHSKELDVKKLTFEWMAPNKSGYVIFYSTMVRHKDTFWVKQPSVMDTGSAYSPILSLAVMCFSLLSARVMS